MLPAVLSSIRGRSKCPANLTVADGNQANLTVADGNQSVNVPDVYYGKGGGILNVGTVTLIGSTLPNFAYLKSGGIFTNASCIAQPTAAAGAALLTF